MPAGQTRALSPEAFLATYVPALTLALGAGMAVPAVPSLARSFHVSFGVATGVVTAFLLGNLVGTLPAGWLIDRIGARRVLILGPVLTAVVAFLVATAGSFPELLVLRFFNGCAAQTWIMARLATVSYSAAPDQRGRQVSWMFGMDNTGKLTGPVLGGFLVAEWGVRAPFVAYGALALATLVPMFAFARRIPDELGSAGRTAGRRRLPLRGIVLPRLAYFGVALFAGLTRGPISADLLHLYAAFAYHLSAKEIGYLATAAAALSLPIGFLSGWLMDRFGRRRTMVPGFTAVMITMVGLAVSAFAHLSLVWYVAVFLLAAAGQALTSGSIQTVGADVAPESGRGVFLGIWRFTGQAGTSVSPTIFALLAVQVGYGASFLFTACSAAVVALLLVRYVPEVGFATADEEEGIEDAAAASAGPSGAV
ncbi:MAG TPA: MFS transporter [Jatrophihabitans sp.]|nr:MFS transporter [Jatrophihabitans sp.]